MRKILNSRWSQFAVIILRISTSWTLQMNLKIAAAADIFCLPSYREGFGMAALEAGACSITNSCIKNLWINRCCK